MSALTALKASALLLPLSFLIGCSGDSPGKNTSEPLNCELSGSSYGIVGGQILSSGNELSSSTVMVVHQNLLGETGICTGTLIDTDTVLTAAHCLSVYGGDTVVAFTNNLDCAGKATTRTVRRVRNTKVHGRYSYFKNVIANAPYDLAILKFTGDVPDGYKVRALPSSDFAPVASDTLVMSGYGVTSEKGGDSGKLRFTTAPASRLLNDVHVAMLEQTISMENTWIVEQYDSGVCSGDSGGALYVDTGKDELTLIGVTSMVMDNRTTEENKENAKVCHGVSVFTDVRPHLDWIDKTKNSL